MDLFSPLRLGIRVTTDLVKVATFVPRTALNLLVQHDGAPEERPAAPRDGATATVPRPTPSGPARGATGRRTPGPAATPRQARVQEGDLEVTGAPPEPTSAAGASGGVAGTAAAPGDAARAGAPDPTAARPTARQRSAPQGERRPTDTRAMPTPREEEPELRVPDAVVESEGAAAPHAEIHVAAPWANYDRMKAPDIVDRLQGADGSVKAIVRLYESTHKKRKSILAATS